MHDYGLSYNPESIAKGVYPSVFPDVKTAVHHICGLNAPLIKLGITGVAKNGSFAASGEESTIFALGEPEGCAFFPEMLEADAIHRAISFCMFEKIKKIENIENGMHANSPLNQNISYEDYHILSNESGDWVEFVKQFDSLVDMTETKLRVSFCNNGETINMRVALLAESEEDVCEKWFQVPSGFSTNLFSPSKLRVLRGIPDISKVKAVLIGSGIKTSQIMIKVEEITPDGINVY